MKTIVVTPSGRERYLKRLYNCMLKQKSIGSFDEWHLWLNTRNQTDIKYIESLGEKHDWIQIIRRHLRMDRENGNEATDHNMYRTNNLQSFYGYCVEPETVYIKIDDDIVWMADDMITNLVKFRLENRDPPLVYANTINNNCQDELHRQAGRLQIYEEPKSFMTLERARYALDVHRAFFKSDFKDLIFDRHEIDFNIRFCINCVSWIYNEKYRKMMNNMKEDDEKWLAVAFPNKVGVKNVVCGNALCVHYIYTWQKESTGLLDKHLDELYPLE